MPGDDQSDSPHSTWLFLQAVAEAHRAAAERRGEDPPPPFDEPEPQPVGPPARCPMCWGKGTVTEAEIEQAKADAEATWEWFGSKMRQMVQSLAAQRIVDIGANPQPDARR